MLPIQENSLKRLIAKNPPRNFQNPVRKPENYLVVETLRKDRDYIEVFNPSIEALSYELHWDFLNSFDAGEGYYAFKDFIASKAREDASTGDGVTYLVFNKPDTPCCKKELVAYYTLAVGSLVYMDMTPLDDDEIEESRAEFDQYQYSIPAAEIKMFAVSEKYQDVFFEYAGESKPVAAWIFQNLIEEITEISTSIIGFKAICLHAVDDYAENFYMQNNFNLFPSDIEQPYSVDADLTLMYYRIHDFYFPCSL